MDMTHDHVEHVRADASMPHSAAALTRVSMRDKQFFARCIFHENRAFEMLLDVRGKRYRCETCGAEGDLFDLVMAAKDCDFAAAVDWVEERTRHLIR